MAYAQMDCQPQMEKKICDAERILNQLTEMVAQANELAEYSASRLSQIQAQEAPCNPAPVPSMPVQPMAPLFNEYRVRLNDIGSLMARVRRMLERIEL